MLETATIRPRPLEIWPSSRARSSHHICQHARQTFSRLARGSKCLKEPGRGAHAAQTHHRQPTMQAQCMPSPWKKRQARAEGAGTMKGRQARVRWMGAAALSASSWSATSGAVSSTAACWLAPAAARAAPLAPCQRSGKRCASPPTSVIRPPAASGTKNAPSAAAGRPARGGRRPALWTR